MSAAKQLGPRQPALHEVITSWPDVRAKQVFGHRGYVRRGKMFAFLADAGVSVKTFSDAEAQELYARPDVVPFEYGPGMEMTAWPVLPLRSDAELDDALTAVRRAYEALGGQ